MKDCSLKCLAEDLPCPIPPLPCVPESCSSIVDLLPSCATEGRPACGSIETPISRVDQLINLGNLPQGTPIFVSIEPPDAALLALPPARWDALNPIACRFELAGPKQGCTVG